MSERHRARGRHRRHTRSAAQPVFAVGAVAAAAFGPLQLSSTAPATTDATSAHQQVMDFKSPSAEFTASTTAMLNAQAKQAPSLRSAPAVERTEAAPRASRTTTRTAAPAVAKKSSAPTAKVVKPVSSYRRISGVFGESRPGHTHTGTDFALPTGSPVRSVQSGVVVDSYYSSTYGNRIVVKHASGDFTSYNHLSVRQAAVGDKVAMGEQIGKVGNTGRSFGAHLHFEVNQGSDPLDKGGFVNPVVWLKNRGLSI